MSSGYRPPKIPKSAALNFYLWNEKIKAAQKYLTDNLNNLSYSDIEKTKQKIKYYRSKCKEQNSYYRLKRKVH